MPALTTKDAVLGTAPELAVVTQPEWNAALADVVIEAPPEPWGDSGRAELAQRLWVAHTLSLANPRLARRALASVTIGPTTKSYAPGASLTAGDWLEQTPYGARLARLVVMFLGPTMAVT